MAAITTIVSVEDLHDRLGDRDLVIVDCRHALADFTLGRRQYNEGHIPGAFFADVERDLAGPKDGNTGRHPLPDPDAFVAFLQSIGVSRGSQVVAYDAGGDMFAARLWFLCRWIGHDAAAVLDGGFTAWDRSGYPVTHDVSIATRTGDIQARLRPELVVDARFVEEHLRSPRMTLIDARGADRFAGQNETIDPVAGRIPGAVNRPFKDNFESAGHFKDADALREEFSAYDDPERVVHQCGSGVSSCVNALAMEIAGLSGSRVYAGSWSEWITNSSRPVETP